MVIFHIILWHNPLINDLLLGHEIYRISLLQQGISHVLFIAEHFKDYRIIPLILSCGSFYAILL